MKLIAIVIVFPLLFNLSTQIPQFHNCSSEIIARFQDQCEFVRCYGNENYIRFRLVLKFNAFLAHYVKAGVKFESAEVLCLCCTPSRCPEPFECAEAGMGTIERRLVDNSKTYPDCCFACFCSL